MIDRLEQAIQSAFLTVGDVSRQGVSAANEAMWHLLQSSVFNGAYQNHYLSTDDSGLKRLLYLVNDHERQADPLRHLIDDEGSVSASPTAPSGSPATPDSLLAAAAARDPLVNRIIHADPTLRQPPVIELLDDVAMRSFSVSMLGAAGDFSFSRFGIRYHRPSWTNQDTRYLVARTDLEIAGILGVARSSHSPEALSVPYVSVNPGFRRQGVATSLYGRLIELARREGRYIARSNSSERTPSAATSRFDSMLSAAGAVHVISGTYLEGAIGAVYAAGFDASGYKKMVDACSTVATARQKLGRHSAGFSAIDHEQALAVRCLANARAAPDRSPLLR